MLQYDFNFLYYMLQCELLCVSTSGSGFYQWVWILPEELDFASGCGYEDPMGQTLCCIMWSTQPWHKKWYACLRVLPVYLTSSDPILIAFDLSSAHPAFSWGLCEVTLISKSIQRPKPKMLFSITSSILHRFRQWKKFHIC